MKNEYRKIDLQLKCGLVILKINLLHNQQIEIQYLLVFFFCNAGNNHLLINLTMSGIEANRILVTHRRYHCFLRIAYKFSVPGALFHPKSLSNF